MKMRLAGEDFTRLARQAFLSDQPSRAWRMVTRGLGGDEGGDLSKAACQVLDGKAYFAGDETEGLYIVEKEDPEYQKQVQYIYAGRVRIDGAWHCPVAKVRTFGQADGKHATAAVAARMEEGAAFDHEEPSRALADVAIRRVGYYAYEGERVVLLHTETGRLLAHPVIFKPVSEPPHWWNEHPTPEAAYEAFLAAGRKCEFRGEGIDIEVTTEDDTLEPVVRASSTLLASAIAEKDLDAERERREELVYEQRERDMQLREGVIRAQVQALYGNDLIPLVDYEGAVVAQVPRIPFTAWALRQTDRALKYTPISPVGLKLMYDSAEHSDWYIGAGFSLQTPYNYSSALHKAAVHTMGELQHADERGVCTILVKGPAVHGTVGREVIVLPNLDPAHLPKILFAQAVITEAGGELAHLAQVALERSLPMVRVPDAVTRYPAGTRVVVDATLGKVFLRP